MSYFDAKDAVISVMQSIAANLGMSDDDCIGYTVDVLFALGFRSHMLDDGDNEFGMPAVWLSSLR